MTSDNLYDTLIEKCDCIAWIPTVRGSLSLDLLDARFLLGDTDKYLVEFKHHKGFVTSRYLLASSLFTFSDSKYYDNIYCRVFRFFFRGSINSKPENNIFCEKFKIENKIPEDKELLTGKLTIVLNLSKNLTDTETKILSSLNNIQGLKGKYQSDYLDKAVSLESLAKQRDNLKEVHDETVTLIKEIENTQEDNSNYRVWNFDVILSRDGILFLKDDTSDVFKKDYFESGTPSDYTNNIPIHRCFKTAMTYVKYLFHNHYHHDKNNDSFLPVTNLHPIRQSDNKKSRIINHQLEPFLQQITKHKRLAENLKCNPIGISSYARSFIDVFHYNGFIKSKKRNKIHRFIQYQETEAKEFLKDKERKRDFFITQNNLPATLAVGLSFLFVVIAIYNFFIDKDSIGLTEKTKIVILCGSFILGCITQLWYVKRLITGNFISPFKNRKKKSLQFLFYNSNLNKKRLSYSYNLYLWLTEKRLIITELGTKLILAIIILILTFLIVFLYFRVLFVIPIS